jgi:hypothetical protein
MPHVAGLTEIELAEKTGTTGEEIRSLIESGILTPGDEQPPFTTRDVARSVRSALDMVEGVRFVEVGAVELKGLTAPVVLHAAEREE